MPLKPEEKESLINDIAEILIAAKELEGEESKYGEGIVSVMKELRHRCFQYQEELIRKENHNSISNLAAETNLLTLNMAIECARINIEDKRFPRLAEQMRVFSEKVKELYEVKKTEPVKKNSLSDFFKKLF